MKKFIVTITEVVHYTIEVGAGSAEEAREAGLHDFLQHGEIAVKEISVQERSASAEEVS